MEFGNFPILSLFGCIFAVCFTLLTLLRKRGLVRVQRLFRRLQTSEWRKYGVVLLIGKTAGLATVLLAVYVIHPELFGFRVFAADQTLPSHDPVNSVNTVWTLTAAFLLFGMQAGFTMLEAGICRSRETLSILTECFVDTCLCGLLFYAFGFAFLFGPGNAFIGYHWFMLQGAPATYGSAGVALPAFWLFQFAFADTCSAITSGVLMGRTSFVGELLYRVAVSGLIYPIVGHWAWGQSGFLTGLGSGFHDFAGASVIHVVGGFVVLAAALVIGPRSDRKFKRDGGATLQPQDLTIAAAGVLLLWFGWYGFNPGSTLSALDFSDVERVASNMTLAALAAGLSSLAAGYCFAKRRDSSVALKGMVAGLVTITCPCFWVSAADASVLGAVAGVIVVLGIEFLEWLRIDDPMCAVSVHGICGIWGTLSLGLFANGKFGTAPFKGLFYGGGTRVLQVQVMGTAVIAVCTFAVALAVLYLLDLVGLLRAAKVGERRALELHEHAIPAYPE